MTPQSTFMITARIGSGREPALRALLSSMNQAPGLADPGNPLVPFGEFAQLHVARFTVLHANTNEDIRDHGIQPQPWSPTLVFVADIDGRLDLFLAELCLRAAPGLRRIFGHCEDFDPEHDDLLPWLRRGNIRPQANYVNWRGRTVCQIREEAVLATFVRKEVSMLVDHGSTLSPETLHRRLRSQVLEEVAGLRLRLSDPMPTPAGWYLLNLLHLCIVPLLLLALSPLLLVLAPVYLLRLRQLEKRDPENLQRPTPEHLQELAAVEDIDVTNHFNVFGQVKPGLFRRATIRVLLWLLDYAARHVYRRGYLTRIKTIHFARWVLLDQGRRVFFASNYDGSADSYMDDFINKVAWGLNLVFSNGVGYPRTNWLIRGGAKFEQKYKYTLRRNQLPSLSWYKAYPGLTAVDLARNQRIREGLESPSLPADELRDWLRLL